MCLIAFFCFNAYCLKRNIIICGCLFNYGNIFAVKWTLVRVIQHISHFRSIVGKAKDFLQNLIRQHDMAPKPTLSINMTEFRTKRNPLTETADKTTKTTPQGRDALRITYRVYGESKPTLTGIPIYVSHSHSFEFKKSAKAMDNPFYLM